MNYEYIMLSEKKKKSDQKGYKLQENMYMEYPQQVNPEGQKGDSWFPGVWAKAE